MKQVYLTNKPFLAFTDETGNSGLNLFDPNQPHFWTGTMLTPVDWDALPKPIHNACLERAGCTELHGNKIGLSGIERIASKLIQLFERYKSIFIFTRIEKRHLAATKFFDTLMDSGLNMAVSNLHYGTRIFRLYLAHIIIALLSENDREEFWLIYSLGDARGFRKILYRLEGRVHSNVEDKRTKQIILDAIS